MKKLLFLLAAGCLLAACDNRREIVEEESIWVRVNLDWTQANISPQSATVYFFPKDGGKRVITLHTNQAVDSVKLCHGSYSILAFSESENTQDGIRFRGMERYETFEAYAAPMPVNKGGKADEETMAMIPGKLAATHLDDLTITWPMIARDQRPTLKLTPQTMLYSTKVIVHVEGFNNIIPSESVASLSGLAAGVSLIEELRSTETVTHQFPLTSDKESSPGNRIGCLETEFPCFGLPGGQISRATGKNILKLKLKRTDGKYFYTERDVSGFITTGSGGILTLIIEVGTGSDDNPVVVVPDNVPIDPGSGSGFDVNVDEWGDKTVIEIPVN